MTATDKIEESAHVLLHEIEKLDSLGLTLAASLVRIAHLDLQMRLHNVTEKEIDLLSFVTNLAEQQKLTRALESEESDERTTEATAGGRGAS
jgi:ribosomal protein S13